jgi:hypothetical protein
VRGGLEPSDIIKIKHFCIYGIRQKSFTVAFKFEFKKCGKSLCSHYSSFRVSSQMRRSNRIGSRNLGAYIPPEEGLLDERLLRRRRIPAPILDDDGAPAGGDGMDIDDDGAPPPLHPPPPPPPGPPFGPPPPPPLFLQVPPANQDAQIVQLIYDQLLNLLAGRNPPFLGLPYARGPLFGTRAAVAGTVAGPVPIHYVRGVRNVGVIGGHVLPVVLSSNEFYMRAGFQSIVDPNNYGAWVNNAAAILNQAITQSMQAPFFNAFLAEAAVLNPVNAVAGNDVFAQIMMRGRDANGNHLIKSTPFRAVRSMGGANPVAVNVLTDAFSNLLLHYDPFNDTSVGSDGRDSIIIDRQASVELRFAFGANPVSVPGGKVKTPKVALNDRTALYRKNSLTKISADGNCAVRAVFLGIILNMQPTQFDFFAMSDTNSNLGVGAFLLAHPPYPTGDAFPSFEALFDSLSVFFDVELRVFSTVTFMQCTYQSPARTYSNGRVFLLDDDGHVSLLNNLLAFFSADSFCSYCNRAFSGYKHSCRVRLCTDCLGQHPTNDPLNSEPLRNCIDCGRVDMTPYCFSTHLENKVCERSMHCVPCGAIMSRRKFSLHVCNLSFCRVCYKSVPKDHQCYHQPLKVKPISELTNIICFDFETDQSTGEHIVNHTESYYCDSEETVIHKDIASFCAWAIRKEHQGLTFIAHNGKGYDFQFILRHCVNSGIVPSIIRQGQKLMSMTIPLYSIRFVDSLNFLAMPLSNFTKTFQLEELKKGFFPHWFNRPENQAYVGPYPPLEDYGIRWLSPKKAAELEQWYALKVAEQAVFDFQVEMVAYCHSDVQLLAAGVLKFRELFIAHCDIDPWCSITLASLCMKIFKTHHLPPNTLAALRGHELEFIRQAFYGGRTDACKLLADFTQSPLTTGAKYIDVNSLYPYVNKCCPYPKGHPLWLFSPFDGELHRYLETYQGIYEVDVTCPTALYHPLLPQRVDGKLVFDLLPKTKECFTSFELVKAVQLGYRITRIYRILYWREWTTSIFSSYATKFHQLKQTASEEKNEGLRSVAKLLLNSLWGKFNEQTDDRAETKFFTSFSEVWSTLTNPDYTVSRIDLCGDSVYEVTAQLNSKRTWDTPSAKINTSIGAFTTAHARLHLYAGLEILQRQVLYYDTDSIIYAIGDPQQFGTDLRVPEGDDLGQWKSELGTLPDGSEDLIVEFMSGGPKNYSYLTRAGKGDVKIKGIVLNMATREMINPTVMRAIITGQLDRVMTPVEQRITRTRGHEIVNTAFQKKYGYTFSKRQVRAVSQNVDPASIMHIDSVPHGYTLCDDDVALEEEMMAL